jgi:hypothetical protein
MSDVTVSVVLDAAPAHVWSVVEPIEHHVDWMADAVSIEFETDQRRGVGTTFLCATRIGPIRLTDRMEITEWQPVVDAPGGHPERGRGAAATAEGAMGVRHTGIVTGTGVFRLQPLGGGTRTLFTWSEQLQFPWYLGGRLGAVVAGRLVLERLWRRNLGALADIVHAR